MIYCSLSLAALAKILPGNTSLLFSLVESLLPRSAPHLPQLRQLMRPSIAFTATLRPSSASTASLRPSSAFTATLRPSSSSTASQRQSSASTHVVPLLSWKMLRPVSQVLSAPIARHRRHEAALQV